MSPPSDDDKVSCYLSSSSLSDDDEVTRRICRVRKGRRRTMTPMTPLNIKHYNDVSQFSVLYGYVLFGTPDQGQTLDVYRSDF